VFVITDSVVGKISAANIPITSRATISCPGVEHSPSSTGPRNSVFSRECTDYG